MKQFMTGFVAAMAMGVMAETVNTVTVTKFHQSYPYSGKATVEYTVGGALPANAVAEITLNTDEAHATLVQSNIVTGANTFTVDFASSFGGALLLTNASFVVTIAEAGLGGVQLWAYGPYWAECNVGATRPEEYGYYFWWGDTVGYRREGNAWAASDCSLSGYSFSYSNTPTYNKSIAILQNEGWITADGVLAPEHDAAHVHWGGEWRMPTADEIDALIDNCTTTWITTNGVSGRLVTGKGEYANRSIFLPAAGEGNGSGLYSTGWYGSFWSSTPSSDRSDFARDFDFDSGSFGWFSSSRCGGYSVRPVRGFDSAVAVGIVTYDPSETQTTEVPVPYAWLRAHDPTVADECEAYEASAQATAANGRKVWECYALGLDPQVATSDFRMASFPMKADGTPDFANVTFDPP